MPWHPDAVRKEITKHQRTIVGPRRLIFHTAVSNVSSLKGYFESVSVCSHWYVQREGGIEQYVDTKYQAPANRDANPDSLSVESWDGYGSTWGQGDPVPPWTSEQVEANARIAAWSHIEHGIPLELIPDSKPGREGIGYHRLGIDPWRVAGGELWSSSYGKICPGPARIAQVPQIIERARELVYPPEVFMPWPIITPDSSKSEIVYLQVMLEAAGLGSSLEQADGVGVWGNATATAVAGISANQQIEGRELATLHVMVASRSSSGGVAQAEYEDHRHAEGKTGPPI